MPALARKWLPCVTKWWGKGSKILESGSLELGAFPWSPTWDHQWMGLASVARAERLKREGRLCRWFLFFSLEFTLGHLLVPLSSRSDTQAPPLRLPTRGPLTQAAFWTSARLLFYSGPALSHLLRLTFLSAYMTLCFSWTLDSFVYSRQFPFFSDFFFFLIKKIGRENGFLWLCLHDFSGALGTLGVMWLLLSC